MSTNNEGTPHELLTPVEKLATELYCWSVLPLGAGTNQAEFHHVSRSAAEQLRQLERSLTATKQRLEVCEKERNKLHGILEGWGILYNTPPLIPTAKEQRDWFDQVWKATCEHLKSDTAKKLEAKLHPSADKKS